ncbi:tyrosine kinase receptor Cad96Ca-like [Penaeus japonicus]|uniref:tyrosine kinase receptor Cad96Ca-like n=1 Tax=Penaeus japonicus TaxID=27405 RepID=UPI001C71467D|nr:tyrosine kinase receptor Cad96Ca-like [Penaeus japonicus]
MNVYALWILVSVLLQCGAVSPLKPPPLLRMGSHDWEFTDDDPVNSTFSRLKVDSDEDVSFSLDSRDGIHTFFRVDEDGRVFIAKPLTEAVGDHILKVYVHNGQSTSTTHFRVTVKKKGEPAKNNAPPVVNNGPSPFPGGGNFPGGNFPGGNFPGGNFAGGNFAGGTPYNNFPAHITGGRPPPPPLPPTSAFGPPEERPPFIKVKPSWSAKSDAALGTVVGKIGVIDLSSRGFNVTLRGDAKDLLHVDAQGGDVTVVRPLTHVVGSHLLEVVASSGGKDATEPVVLTIEKSSTLAPTPTPTPTQPQPSSNPTKATTKSYQDLLVIENGGSSSSSSNSAPSPSSSSESSTTVSPKEASADGSLSLTVIPIVLVVGMSPLVLAALWYWRRLKRRKARAESKESAVVYTEKGIEAAGTENAEENTGERERGGSRFGMGVSALWRKRAENNKYEEGVKNGEQKGKRKMSQVSSANSDIWEFPRHRLKVMGILGEGCFGQVWKCEAVDLQGKGTMLVAVKTLKESAGDRERRDLVQELKVLKSLGSHLNVVSFLGCCTEKDPIFVILEYMIGGKLQSYLRASRADTPYDNLHGSSSSLTPRDLIHFAYQISRGMEFLARNGVIHRDLAARNILVGEDKICKVADFGFARDVANNRVYERKSDGRLPIRWMAPESLFDNIFTTKSDVWSFGVLMWEIVTLGSTPYPGMGAAEVMRKVKEGYRLEKPEHCRREIYNIMYYCWDKDSKERPSFTELVHTLEGLLMSEVEYIELDRFPDHSYYNILSENTSELL